MMLAQYSFPIRHRPGTKNINADTLPRQYITNSMPTETMNGATTFTTYEYMRNIRSDQQRM